MLDEARCVELYAERFGEYDSLPLCLLQWFISRLNSPVRLGPIRAGNRAVIVTKVQGEYSSSEMHRSEPKAKFSSSNKDKKKGKGKESKSRDVDILLVPESSVTITFQSYRFVLCLDVSKAVFSFTEEGLPFTVLVDAMLSFIMQLSQIPAHYIQSMYVSIIATAGLRADTVYHLWQGNLRCKETDVSMLLKLLQDRISSVQDDIFQDFQECSGSDAPGPAATLADVAAVHSQYPDMKNFTQAISTELESLPATSCPLAVLFTSGSMHVDSSSPPHCNLGPFPVALHVVLENISTQRSVGFYADIAGLQALTQEMNSGSLITLSSRHSGDIHSAVASMCTADLFACDIIDARKEAYSVASSSTFPLNRLTFLVPNDMSEMLLQSYQLEGAAAEHLLCSRLCDGFSIVSISQESGGTYNSLALDSSDYRGYLRKPASRQLTICMRKAASAMSSIVYELTFVPRLKNVKATSFGVRKLQTSQKLKQSLLDDDKISSVKSLFDFEKIFLDEFMWSTGILSIDIRKIGTYAQQDQGIASFIANTATEIFKSDKKLATFLGDFVLMRPDCSQQQPPQECSSPSSRASFRRDSYSLDMSNHDIFKSSKRRDQSGKVSQGSGTADSKTFKKPSRPLAKQLAAYEDLIEKIISFDKPKYLYLFGFADEVGGLQLAPPHRASMGRNSFVKEKSLEDIIAKALDTLPYPDIHKLSPSKWLVAVCNMSDQLLASDTLPAESEIERGIVQLEVTRIAGLFVNIRIGAIGPCAHAMGKIAAALASTIETLHLGGSHSGPPDGKSHVLSLQCNHFQNRTGNRYLTGNLRNCSTLRTARSLTTFPRPTNRRFRSLVMNELIGAKLAVGFQLATNAVKEATWAAALLDSSDDTVQVKFFAVSSFNPTGIYSESIIECNIDCTCQQLIVEYNWLKSCNESRDEALSILWQHEADVASCHLEDLIHHLMSQDDELFALYSVVLTLSEATALPNNDIGLATSDVQEKNQGESTTSAEIDHEVLHAAEWEKMISLAWTESIRLPCMASFFAHSGMREEKENSEEKGEQEGNDALMSGSSGLGSDPSCYRVINRILQELLLNSLLSTNETSQANPSPSKNNGASELNLRMVHVASRRLDDKAQEDDGCMCLYGFTSDVMVLIEIDVESECATLDKSRGENGEEKGPDDKAGVCNLVVLIHHLPLPTGKFSGPGLMEASAATLLTLPRSTSMTSLFFSPSDTTPRQHFSIAELAATIKSRHLSHLVRVVFLATRSGIIVQAEDVKFCLEQCNQAQVEVDISLMCRRRSWGKDGGAQFNTSDTDSAEVHSISSAAAASLENTFLTTIGTKIRGLLNSEIFVLKASLDAPNETRDPDSLHSLALSARYDFATWADSTVLEEFVRDLKTTFDKCLCIFVSFYLSYRGSDESSSVFSTTIVSSAAGVARAIVQICSSFWSSNSLDSSEIWLGMTLYTFPHAMTSVLKDRKKSLVNDLSHELRSFVAMDTLNSLLLLPATAVSAETLLQVQQCLKEVPCVKSMVISLDFVTPSAGSMVRRQRDSGGYGGSSSSTTGQHDYIAGFFENELREQYHQQLGNAVTVMKIGEIMYARSWSVPEAAASGTDPDKGAGVVPPSIPLERIPSGVASIAPPRVSLPAAGFAAGLGETVASASASPQTVRQIPCWVLITISHSVVASNSAGTPGSQGSATGPTLTMKINVSIRKTEGAEAVISQEHEKIARSVEISLGQCCYRINQRILLRELHESKTANPLMIPLRGDAPLTANLTSPIVTSAAVTSQESKVPTPSTAAGAKDALAPPPLIRVTSAAPIHSVVASATAGPVSAVKSGPVSAAVPGVRSRERAVTSLINLIPPRTSTKSKLAMNQAASAPPSTQMTFGPQYLAFACPVQEVIACKIHAGAALTYEVAVRHLEKFALSQFAIENNDRYFVSEDANGNVHYMTFERDRDLVADAVPAGRDATMIRLSIHGLLPMDKNMRNHLQVLLDHRLMEITSKTVSAVLSRSSTLFSSYGNFIRQNGKSVHFRIPLPAFVKDVYLYLTIVRQVMIASQVLSKVNEQSPKQVTQAELLHPASIGYSLRRDGEMVEHSSDRDALALNLLAPLPDSTSAAALVGIGKLHTSDRPRLVRKGKVVYEASNPATTSPIFFGRQNLHRADAKLGGEMQMVWQQSDFTLLYNNMGPLPQSSSAQLKAVSKAVGQGLALIEIFPHVSPSSPKYLYFSATNQIIASGARSMLEDDIVAMTQFLATDSALCVVPVASSPASSSSNQFQGEGSGVTIGLRIYQTLPMHIEALVEYCSACFNHALTMYATERLLAACGSPAGSGQESSVSKRASPTFAVGTERIDEGSEAHAPKGGSAPARRLSGSTASTTVSKTLSLLAYEAKVLPVHTSSSASCLPSTKFDEFLQLLHSLLARHVTSPHLAPFCGYSKIACALPKRRAQLVHRMVLCRILECYPQLQSTLITASCEPLFSRDPILPPASRPADPALGDTLRWFHAPCGISGQVLSDENEWLGEDGDHGITVCVLGEECFVRGGELDGADSSAPAIADPASEGAGEASQQQVETQDLRYVPNLEGCATARPDEPRGLRKRRCILELAIGPDGIYIFHVNILPSVIANISDIIVSACSTTLQHQRGIDGQYLAQLQGYVSMCEEPLYDDKFLEAGLDAVEVLLLAQCIARLSWERRVMDRLYLNRAQHRAAHNVRPALRNASAGLQQGPDRIGDENTSKSRCLNALPKAAWRRGALLNQIVVPLPQRRDQDGATVFADYIQRLRIASLKFACDLVERAYEPTSTDNHGPDYEEGLVRPGIFIVLPLPLTALVIVSEVQPILVPTGTAAQITHRVIKVLDILWDHGRGSRNGHGRFSIGCFVDDDAAVEDAGQWAGWNQASERAANKAHKQYRFILSKLGVDSLAMDGIEENEVNAWSDGARDNGWEGRHTQHPIAIEFQQMFINEARALLLDSLLTVYGTAALPSNLDGSEDIACRGPSGLIAGHALSLASLLVSSSGALFVQECSLNVSLSSQRTNGQVTKTEDSQDSDGGFSETAAGSLDHSKSAAYANLAQLVRRGYGSLALLDDGDRSAIIALRFKCCIEDSAHSSGPVSAVEGVCFIWPDGDSESCPDLRTVVCAFYSFPAATSRSFNSGDHVDAVTAHAPAPHVELAPRPTEHACLLDAIKAAVHHHVESVLRDLVAKWELEQSWVLLESTAESYDAQVDAVRILTEAMQIAAVPEAFSTAGLDDIMSFDSTGLSAVKMEFLLEVLEVLAESEAMWDSLGKLIHGISDDHRVFVFTERTDTGFIAARHIFVLHERQRGCGVHLKGFCCGFVACEPGDNGALNQRGHSERCTGIWLLAASKQLSSRSERREHSVFVWRVLQKIVEAFETMLAQS